MRTFLSILCTILIIFLSFVVVYSVIDYTHKHNAVVPNDKLPSEPDSDTPGVSPEPPDEPDVPVVDPTNFAAVVDGKTFDDQHGVFSGELLNCNIAIYGCKSFSFNITYVDSRNFLYFVNNDSMSNFRETSTLSDITSGFEYVKSDSALWLAPTNFCEVLRRYHGVDNIIMPYDATAYDDPAICLLTITSDADEVISIQFCVNWR